LLTVLAAVTELGARLPDIRAVLAADRADETGTEAAAGAPGDREGRARAGTRRSRAGAARSLTISLFVEIPQLIRCGISTIMGRAAAP
jgi:hypothetical protein